MISLLTFSAFLLASLLIQAAVLARVARALGSPRGRFRVAVAAILVVGVFNIALSVISTLIAEHNQSARLLIGLVTIGLQLVIAVAVLQRMFWLTTGRTLALVGADLVVAVMIVTALLLAYRPYVDEAFSMPTQSMSPTVNAGDRFFAEKVAKPRRWDVVAYRAAIDGERQNWCKRLIGLPGERLRLQQGKVYVNDRVEPLPADVKEPYPAPFPMRVSGVRYHDGDTIQLGPDEIFLVGDNGSISNDSRVQGPAHLSDLIGVVDFRYRPPSRIKVLR